MAFNQELAYRIRQNLQSMGSDLMEKKMFGGVAFLYKGKMTVGINGDELMVRVIDGKWQEVLQQPHVREMEFTGKPMKEFVHVKAEGFATEVQLAKWINLGIEHAQKKLGE